MYDKSAWIAELIVRVPHLLASEEEGKKVLLSNYKKLYKYFMNVVITRAKEFLANPQRFLEPRKILTLNKQLYAHLIIHEDLWLNLPEIEVIQQDALNIIVSNVPHLCMTHFYQSYQNSKASKSTIQCILVTLNDLKNQIHRATILKMWKGHPNVLLVVNCEKTNRNFENLWNEIDELEMGKKLLLICESNEKAEEINRSFSKLKNVRITESNYNWNDLTDESKQKLTRKRINFQGKEIELSQIVPESSAILSSLPLNEIFSSSSFNVGSSLMVSNEYEKGIEKILKIDEEDFEIIINKSEMNRQIVLYDSVGIETSTILIHLALKIKEFKPETWILKISLPETADELNKCHKCMTFLEDAEKMKEFIYERFARSINQTKFEKKLFFELINNQRVILMLDGTYEINEVYQEVMLKFAELALSLPLQIWIAARPELIRKFENQFNVKCWLTTRLEELSLNGNSEQARCASQQELCNLIQSESAVGGMLEKVSEVEIRSDVIKIKTWIDGTAEEYNTMQKKLNENAQEKKESMRKTACKELHNYIKANNQPGEIFGIVENEELKTKLENLLMWNDGNTDEYTTILKELNDYVDSERLRFKARRQLFDYITEESREGGMLEKIEDENLKNNLLIKTALWGNKTLEEYKNKFDEITKFVDGEKTRRKKLLKKKGKVCGGHHDDEGHNANLRHEMVINTQNTPTFEYKTTLTKLANTDAEKDRQEEARQELFNFIKNEKLEGGMLTHVEDPNWNDCE